MKSVLVPIEDHTSMSAVLETARQAAMALSANLCAIPLRAMQFQVVGAEPIVAVSFPPADQDDEDASAKARSIYDAFVARHGESAAKAAWLEIPPVDDIGLGSLARVYDMTVLGRPSSNDAGARMTTLEAVLFDSGRPVLIAPSQPSGPIGKNIVISWNRSTEAARTLSFAMPLLKTAEKITVLTLDEAVVPGPLGSEVCRYLRDNDIASDELTVSAGGRRPGAAILQEATRLECDLLIKSAYTQSRLRQMIFGGATSHILAHAEIPVFMAN